MVTNYRWKARSAFWKGESSHLEKDVAGKQMNRIPIQFCSKAKESQLFFTLEYFGEYNPEAGRVVEISFRTNCILVETAAWEARVEKFEFA